MHLGGTLGDWTIWETRWDRLRARWLAAPPERRLALSDGRPAVLDEDGRRVFTLPVPIWRAIRSRVWLDARTRRRERRCAGCGSVMTVRREYSHAWTFACPTCHSVEVHSKDRVGGTIGAGEREPDERARREAPP